MRTVRLHDTRTGALKELTPRAGGKVGIYACGPTVYGRIHVGNARPFVVFSLLKRFLAHEGYDPVLVANITDINDKIYDAARARGPALRRARGGDDRPLLRRHRAARARAAGPRAARDADDRRDRRPDRRPDRARPRVRGRRRRLLPRPLAARVRRAVAPRHRPDGPGRGARGRPARKEDPLDFALWKARKPMEDTWWSAPWGEGRPGLAHRVLGDGGGDARRRRSRSTAAATT